MHAMNRYDPYLGKEGRQQKFHVREARYYNLDKQGSFWKESTSIWLEWKGFPVV